MSEAYSLNELLEILDIIKNEGQGPLNFPKALMALAGEILILKAKLRSLEESSAS